MDSPSRTTIAVAVLLMALAAVVWATGYEDNMSRAPSGIIIRDLPAAERHITRLYAEVGQRHPLSFTWLKDDSGVLAAGESRIIGFGLGGVGTVYPDRDMKFTRLMGSARTTGGTVGTVRFTLYKDVGGASTVVYQLTVDVNAGGAASTRAEGEDTTPSATNAEYFKAGTDPWALGIEILTGSFQEATVVAEYEEYVPYSSQRVQ